jgi:hypothetical protein
MTQWTSVKDKLPDSGRRVGMKSTHKAQCDCHPKNDLRGVFMTSPGGWYFVKSCKHSIKDKQEVVSVTHWKYLWEE